MRTINFSIYLKLTLFLIGVLDVMGVDKYPMLLYSDCFADKLIYCLAKKGDDWKSETKDLPRQRCCFYFAVADCLIDAINSQCKSKETEMKYALTYYSKYKSDLNNLDDCKGHNNGGDCTLQLAWWAITLIVIGVLVVVVGLAVGGYFYAKKKRIHVCCL
jgi:hypothetical protein